MVPPTILPGGWTRRMMQLAVTDLPEPDSPTMAVTFPLGMSKPTSTKACVSPMSVLKSTASSRTRRTLSISWPSQFA